MVPKPHEPGKRRAGRPSKALLSVVQPEPPRPGSERRRPVLALYRRCIAAHARLLAQAEELSRVEGVLHKFLVQDLAESFHRQEVAMLQGVLEDITHSEVADLPQLIDELTVLVQWLRETHLL